MSGFDRRWQRLVESARALAPESTQAAGVRAEDLAEIGLAFARENRRASREGRGLALAGLLYIGCLCGAGSLSDSLGWTPDVRSAARELAQAHRHLPSASFVPLLEDVPALQVLAPARALEALERCWLTEDDSTEEPR